MRTAFIETLELAAAADPNVCLVVGDLGFSVIDKFARNYPNQFVNAGVAEQNMTGLAVGMALSGKIVFTYSIANFTTLRCLEQIRNDVCYHHANVKIVSVGGGVAYGNLGISHHATEDLAILRSLPNMLVVAPGDPVEAKLATEALVKHPGPAYLRLGKAGEKVMHLAHPEFRLGRAISMRHGQDITLISTGGILATASNVCARLVERGIDVRFLSMHTISPIDEVAVRAAATETRYVFTLEEHSVVGGLGSAIAEVLAELETPHAPLKRIGFPRGFMEQVGDQEYLRSMNGLDEEGVFTTMLPLIERSFGRVG